MKDQKRINENYDRVMDPFLDYLKDVPSGWYFVRR